MSIVGVQRRAEGGAIGKIEGVGLAHEGRFTGAGEHRTGRGKIGDFQRRGGDGLSRTGRHIRDQRVASCRHAADHTRHSAADAITAELASARGEFCKNSTNVFLVSVILWYSAADMMTTIGRP